MTSNRETDLLKGWHLKIAIIAGLILPAVTATGAFYDLKAQIAARDTESHDRIAALELSNQKEFADKETIKDMQTDIKQMHSDIVEIKTLLLRRAR
jgi:hypothetical protein